MENVEFLALRIIGLLMKGSQEIRLKKSEMSLIL